mmetsp:Transcript_27815/g.46152  ORF Transcript_27815/g.46152 Transcript_27815/m.46152 type:complete len:91 (+) Transcript_27815:106-378(+)
MIAPAKSANNQNAIAKTCWQVASRVGTQYKKCLLMYCFVVTVKNVDRENVDRENNSTFSQAKHLELKMAHHRSSQLVASSGASWNIDRPQ